MSMQRGRAIAIKLIGISLGALPKRRPGLPWWWRLSLHSST